MVHKRGVGGIIKETHSRKVHSYVSDRVSTFLANISEPTLPSFQVDRGNIIDM